VPPKYAASEGFPAGLQRFGGKFGLFGKKLHKMGLKAKKIRSLWGRLPCSDCCCWRGGNKEGFDAVPYPKGEDGLKKTIKKTKS